MITVPVPLANGAYDVLIGAGARHRLSEVLPPGVGRAAIVTQREIGIEVEPGLAHRVFHIEHGEQAKSLASVERLCREMADYGLTRQDVVVALGGGVVTDTGGLAAALYHRGVALVNVPTTLLGQIDAAIGGKTGVNLPEGKNLIGAFWQPRAVLCDTEVLESLPPREYASGLGEMAKYHFLTHDGSGPSDLDALDLDERVARCVEIKASVVAADPDESGGRARLNYGHTLAHALETAGRYDLRHGEAVAIGLVFAARLAHRLERVGRDYVDEHYRVVEGYGLPTALDVAHDRGELIDLMGRDKKAVDGLTFALGGPAGIELVSGVAEADVAAALAGIGS